MSNPTDNTLRVAIIGAGPSGFYAAEALLRSEYSITVDVYEKLPVPYGLVRFGVAPDHPKLKLVVNVFDRIAKMNGFRFIGNVCIGQEVSVETLSQFYHAVIFACGAESERDLEIPGESLSGSYSAREFVGWYNGHPEYRHLHFDFSHERAVVIGQGNVALDVARILSKTAAELRHTDIADYALQALAESQIRHIHIIGRRGPVQARFTDKELREFGELENCTPDVSLSDLELDAASKQELLDSDNTATRNNLALLQAFAKQPATNTSRTCHFQFFQSPVSLGGINSVESIVLEKNTLSGKPFQLRTVASGEKVTLDCGLVFRCIGYRARQIPGLHYDDKTGVLSNRDGRVYSDSSGSLSGSGSSDSSGSLGGSSSSDSSGVANGVLPGLYATGWIKRGANGTIGSNRGDSVATVAAVLEDRSKLLYAPKQHADQLLANLNRQGCKTVDYSDWKKIDAQEVARGIAIEKPRNKLTTIPEMLEAVSG